MGYSMALGSVVRPNASCVGINLWETRYPSDLHFNRQKKGPGVGTSPLPRTKWVGTVVSSIAMCCPSLENPIERSGDHTQAIPSLRVLSYGTLRNRKLTVFLVF
jgi:hypothetical protein